MRTNQDVGAPWVPVWSDHRAEGGDVVCQHGTAIDVHCCNCHSGFLFDGQDCECEFDDEEGDDDGED